MRAHVIELLDRERERWPLWLPVNAAIGIGIYFALPMEPPLWLVATLPVAAIAVGLLSWKRPVALITAVALGMVALGFAAAAWRTHQLDAPVLVKRLGPALVTGRVIRVEPSPKGARITLGQVEIPKLTPAETPGRVRIRVYRAEADLLAGDWIKVRAMLLPPPSPAAPGAFDFARHAYFQGLGAVGFAVGSVREINPATGPPTGPGAADSATFAQRFRLWLAQLRQTVHRRITEGLEGTAGAVAAALMTGERGAIPADVMDSMRASGLAHLLAISGLHIGLVTGILFFAIRGLLAVIEPLALRFAIKKWAAGVALVGAFAYLLLTGLTVPTQRAFVMAAMVLLAVVIDRTAISMRLVAWAALIVLALAPESLLGASFQMSFAAVTALVATYEALRTPVGRLRSRLRWWHLALLYLAGVALTTMVAGAATAPFAAYHFNRVAVYGLAANLTAVPITALWIMPWATLGYLLMPFGLEGVALAPMGWGIDGVISIARTVSHWPGAVTLVPAMSAMALVLVALGGLWLCIWQRPWRLAGLAVIILGLVAVPHARIPDIMVSGDGKLMAVRTADGGLMLSSLKRNRFDRESWLRRAGLVGAKAWSSSAGPGRTIACDAMGCLYRTRGNIVALVRRPDAFLEDCWVADLVIAVVPLRRRRCPKAKLVIDRFDLWRNGAYAMWIDRDFIRAESVLGIQGIRPWSRIRKPRKKPR